MSILPNFIKTLSRPPLKVFIKRNLSSCLCSYNIVKQKSSHSHRDLNFRLSSLHGVTLMKRDVHTSLQSQNSSNSLTEAERLSVLSSQMNMRLVNENSFLSWCRNAYLSSVVGVAMMEQAASSLAQVAGFGAFMIGGMNLFWGTGCHITNLIRLRHVTGMSTTNLSLNVMGSFLHCLLYSIVLVLYMGFLDERNSNRAEQSEQTGASGMSNV